VYLGSVHGTQAALRRMIPRDRGTVIQVGSALSRRGIPLQATYCGAKHALMGFYDSLRTELLHHGSNVQIAVVQLPGLNTPQFGWVRTRVDHHPQPVPPIYQPEVAARAIADAAERPRRETWVGAPTVMTILGNAVAPALVDRYLARTNFKAQQVPDRPIDPDNRRDNLFAPPPGDPGAHGIFDAQAHERSPQAWLAERKLGVAVVGAVAAGGAALRRRFAR
jgi:NAD(P)-dependent dehydrogenase (short-subunit alcohol dehydrogenase family)